MFRFHTPPSLRLSRGELLSWRQTHSVQLQVQSGLLWVTRENDLDDHFLRPGDSLLLPRSVQTLISAEEAASLRFQPVESRSRAVWHRLSRYLLIQGSRVRCVLWPTHRSVLQKEAATVIG